MQTVNRDVLIEKALTLLENGTVDRVYGWKVGEFSYDVTPAVFKDADSIKKDFVFSAFCGANFSKYLVKECQKVAAKAGAKSISSYVKIVYRPEGEVLTIEKKVTKHQK